ASAVGMDKIMMKNIFAQHNLPQPRFLFCRRCDWERSKEEIISRVEKQLKYPCFVKPANLGS
ncbi:MAG TPA: D-alanine--D-alanine ligase, partial [Desulfotomaculum sp.]|nr:D-alanine--D-alanine ligase [Desulfotomaculum sp.]